MLATVYIDLALYRHLKPRLHAVMALLVADADKDGHVRLDAHKLAEIGRMSLATVHRHVGELVKTGVITRETTPEGVIYQVDRRFMAQRESAPC